MGCFLWKDNVIYDELWNVTPGWVSKGQSAVKQDTFGFYIKDAEAVDEEILFIYHCRQVQANKRTGSGEDILSGDRLYYIPAEDIVTPNAGNQPGVNSYFCGIAKKDADASETTVLMNFDGSMWDQTI